MAISEGETTANGLTFGYLTDGPDDGPLALCLHGFPDSAYTWRHLLPALGEAGYRAVAPWMRGYAPTEVPRDGRYQTGALVADAVALHEALGADSRAVIIGHDWGATATYGAATHAPERWGRVVTMAVPPAGAFGPGFLTYDQLRRSWYMFFFQHPLAEGVVALDDLAFVERLWADWSPGLDPAGAATELPHVKNALRSPENLAAALGYYRSALGSVAPDPALAAEQAATQASTPQATLYLHGRDDGCIGVQLAERALDFMGPGSRVEVVEGAGHFLHVERPDEVNRLILDFLSPASPAGE